MAELDIVVIGGGVIGLAIARHLAAAGRVTALLEREARIGSGISARNSQVIHAGIYYPAGSRKAALCVRGRSMLYDFCRTRRIAHRKIGKLIVSPPQGDLGMLTSLASRARQNGVADLRLLSSAELERIEPALVSSGALLSPSSGILDVPALLDALLAEFESAGGTFARGEVVEWRRSAKEVSLGLAGGDRLTTNWVVNAAGLGAARLAALDGLSVQPRLAKGSYFALATATPFQRLIYPLPEPGGLGIHFTLGLDGSSRFGPDVEWVDQASYHVDNGRAGVFYDTIRGYWPGLPEGSLTPAFAGVRPKLANSDDFEIVQCDRAVHLLGIDSPGLTSCLAIARHVARLIR